MRINGLQSFQVKLRHRRAKYKDYLSTITWIKIPVTGNMVRFMGISSFHQPDSAIDSCVSSIRMLDYEELQAIQQTKLRLVNSDSLRINQLDSSKLEEIRLLNSLDEKAKLEDNTLYKTLVKEALLQN